MFKRLSSRRYRTQLRHGILHKTEDPPEGGGGGGGGSREKEKPVSEVVSSLIRRYGDANTALGVLAGENRDYRRRHRDDAEKIEQLSGKAPAKGSLLLTPEQAKEWEAFVALGKASEVKAKVEKVDSVEAQLAERNRKDLLRDVGAAVGYKPTVLEDRVKADGLHVEMREVEQDDGKGGKAKVPVPHVRKADKADEPLIPLKEYAEKNWVDYLPSLTAEATAGNQGGNNGTLGVAFPATTHSSKGGSGTGILAAHLKVRNERAAAGNALNPVVPKEAAAK